MVAGQDNLIIFVVVWNFAMYTVCLDNSRFRHNNKTYHLQNVTEGNFIKIQAYYLRRIVLVILCVLLYYITPCNWYAVKLDMADSSL